MFAYVGSIQNLKDLKDVHGYLAHKEPPPPPHAGLFVGVSQKSIEKSLSSFGDKCPQNGSKNEETAPRTKTGYPHIGPSVVGPQGIEWPTVGSWGLRLFLCEVPRHPPVSALSA